MSTQTVRPAGANQELRAQVVLFWTLAIALPVAVLFNVEVWLESNYTRGLFHLQGFTDLYVSGIFRYRLLGRLLLLKTYYLLLHFVPNKPFPMPGDTAADLPFVLAYTVLNGVCFLLANLTLLSLSWVRKEGFRTEVLSLYFFSILLMSVSMAVVTPYDQLAYLLLLVAVLGVRTENVYLAYGLIATSAVAGMLNRETEFLATALLVTLALFAGERLSRRLWTMAAVHLVLCLAVYIGLRIRLSGRASVSSVLTFGGKWGPAAGVIVLALLLTTLVLAHFLYDSYRPALVFILLSSPYLALVFFTGVLRELRLFIPIILCIFCLYDVLRREKLQCNRGHPGLNARVSL